MPMPRRRSHTRRMPKGHPRGTLSARPGGYGFVITAEGEYFIPQSKMHGAFDGDLVDIAPLPNQGKYRMSHHETDAGYEERSNKGGYKSGSGSGKKPFARVVAVVQRAHDVIVGRYEIAEPFGVVVPEDPRINYDIFTQIKETPGIPDGSIVSVRITSFPTRNSAATGIVQEVLGEADDERIPIDLIVGRHKFETSFSEASLEQARNSKLDVESALSQGYRDLRKRFIFTIDPADARDFDDAVSLEPVSNSQSGAVWRLGVHIADVGHYVPWGSSIDLDARRRATSVYLVDRVIPMLPEELSCDLCSLRPFEARRTMTVDMYLDAEGKVLSSDIYPAIIESAARLTYDQAQELLENRDGDVSTPALSIAVPEVLALSGDLAKRIRGLSFIAKQRAAARREVGGIDFKTVEARVRLDTEGAPVDVDLRRKTDATELIEESMILANETVARFLRDKSFPCIYRVHEAPSYDSLEGLIPVLDEYPWFKKIGAHWLLSGDPHAVAAAVSFSEDRPEGKLVNMIVLRSMMRAVYKPDCEPHYGLASEAYCHFTSPIRRYPDLVVHRMLKAALAKRGEKFDQEVSSLAWIAEHSSKMEREAEKASQESQMVKIVELMEQHVGETFSARVTGATSYGLFVQLENTAEGMIRIEDLGREYFLFDSLRHRLIGADSGREYRLGQQMAVMLVSADRRTCRLDFKPIRKNGKKPVTHS